MSAKQIVKWPGGKGQLLKELHKRIDPQLASGNIDTYIEPFIGGGALMWDVISRGDISHVYFGDMNGELINLYKMLLSDSEALCKKLSSMAKAYLKETDESKREAIYYKRRSEYNKLIDKYPDANYTGKDAVTSAALFMFLNRTCFNGLYRVNKDNHFNVPFGRYKNPPIDQSAQIRENAQALATVPDLTIAFASYEESLLRASENSFVYLDPPYRPLPDTASFTAYAKSGFNDDNQRQLVEYCKELDKLGAKFMLSNSDPHNVDPNDDFFDDLYADFTIERVYATRAINSDKDKRGKITEILVRNF